MNLSNLPVFLYIHIRHFPTVIGQYSQDFLIFNDNLRNSYCLKLVKGQLELKEKDCLGKDKL